MRRHQDEERDSRRRAPRGGGALGTPSFLPEEAPPAVDQEANWGVSGGGLAGPDDREPPRRAARRSAPGTIPEGNNPELTEELLTRGAQPSHTSEPDPGSGPHRQVSRPDRVTRPRRALLAARSAAASLLRRIRGDRRP